MGIQLEQVSFSYGAKTILKEIDLRVKTGEHIGIIGESGSGKSTLLKLISGLYSPVSGKISVEGATTLKEIQGKAALVMQGMMLFPATIKENITCGHDMEEAAIRKYCEAAQLMDWVLTLEDGLDTYVGERGSKVSGGQAQRICIARAMAKNAPVVLLDEATSALDQETGKAVMKAIEILADGRTVIHVTHRPEMLKNCRRMLLLEGGRLYDKGD